MKKAVLTFLSHERDLIAEELRQLQKGERQVIHLNGGMTDISGQHIASLEQRLIRFEELIAATAAGVA